MRNVLAFEGFRVNVRQNPVEAPPGRRALSLPPPPPPPSRAPPPPSPAELSDVLTVRFAKTGNGLLRPNRLVYACTLDRFAGIGRFANASQGKTR